MSQKNSKPAELLSPVVPGPAVLVLPTEAEDLRPTLVSASQGGAKLSEKWQRAAIHPLGKLDMTVNRDDGCLFLKNAW